MHYMPSTKQDTDSKPPRDEHPQSDSTDSSADVNTPFAPHEDDDSALGDSDQHSTA